MKYKKGNLFINLVIIILFVILGFLIYSLYQAIPGEPQEITMFLGTQQLEENFTGEARQFYPNMRFNHNQLTYTVDSYCSKDKRERMIEAFRELELKTEIISFSAVNENPDIEISCSEGTSPYENKDYFISA